MGGGGVTRVTVVLKYIFFFENKTLPATFKLESFLSVNGSVIESFHPIIISHGWGKSW